MAIPAKVKPELLSWAIERSGRDSASLLKKWPQLGEWLQGIRVPSFSQLQAFARYTYTPLGYLFLPRAPQEPVPIPDFRTFGNAPPLRPSADLLDTIYACQRRQAWYADYARRQGFEDLPFAGEVTSGADVNRTAEAITRALGFTIADRSQLGTRRETRSFLIGAISDLGVLVTVSGTVGSNTHRALDPQEFRGFTLFDKVAPTIFVNGKDYLGPQIFTLVHELAHVWAGDSGLSDASLEASSTQGKELWANRVAAEVLAPMDVVRREYRGSPDATELDRLSQVFKVSTLVVLRRIHDAGYLEWDDFRVRYAGELARILELAPGKGGAGGGNFYNTLPFKVGGQRFVRAVVADTLEGGTLYREAYSLLGTSTHSTFQNLVDRVMA
jgi:Zn-dependent peptidase ImmA (M78 family)